ncbi:hypothetical protein [Clostridium massiliamazoniense]|uniref:hypothetical protein n=1 Tax=Clostridium massiliamazoniense TaxID=1347366 RepID=UPI0006D8326D|nr:hypothetical protein [Clostridium massiliamazoniense]
MKNINRNKDNKIIYNNYTTKKNLIFGRSGPLIAIFPVVLSDFTTTVKCELPFKSPILSINHMNNKISLKAFELLPNNNDLLISGEISKTALVITNKEKIKTTFILPFKSIIKVKYSTYPQYNSKENSLYEFNDLYKIQCYINSINIKDEIIDLDSENNKVLLTSLVFHITITQHQQVFIPDTYDDVDIVEEKGNGSRNNPRIVDIAVDSNKKLLGKILK